MAFYALFKGEIAEKEVFLLLKEGLGDLEAGEDQRRNEQPFDSK